MRIFIVLLRMGKLDHFRMIRNLGKPGREPEPHLVFSFDTIRIGV